MCCTLSAKGFLLSVNGINRYVDLGSEFSLSRIRQEIDLLNDQFSRQDMTLDEMIQKLSESFPNITTQREKPKNGSHYEFTLNAPQQ